ncbi:hypothetical protein Mgra_00009490, partial [Meloidogyne graminicola]
CSNCINCLVLQSCSIALLCPLEFLFIKSISTQVVSRLRKEMFFEQEEKEIDPKDYIPILNKSTAQPPPPQQSTPSPSADINQNQQNNNQNNKKQTNGQNRTTSKLKLPSKHPEFVEFMVYEHFALSKSTVKEMCKPGTACDVHIYFYENFTQLPQIGVSCLSFKDLWSEQAEMQGDKTKPDALAFIKLISYRENTRRWMDIEPLAFQILTISLDCADSKGLKIRFSMMKETPSSWFWLQYPIFINDFSLVIGIEKKDLLRRYSVGEKEGSLQILTTFGLLNNLIEQQKKEEEKYPKNIKIIDLEEDQKINGKEEINNNNINGYKSAGRIDEEECLICYSKGSDVLFYPCSHCVVHSEKLINLKFQNFQQQRQCIFCDDKKCQRFDSYFYPCGCSLGCFEGFKKSLKMQKSKMSLRCGNMIENVMQFYRA